MAEQQRTYKPAEGLARTTMILLAVTIAVDVLMVPLFLLDAMIGVAPADYGTDTTYDLIAVGYVAVGALSLLTRVPAVIAFWMWMYRVSSNLHALGLEGLEFSPASMVWWWLIPCANLFLPYKAMRELELRSSTEGLEAPIDQTHSPLVTAWWVCWVIGGFIGRASLRVGDELGTLGTLFVDGASTGVVVVAGILAIRVVQHVQRLHSQKYARLVESGAYAGPPLTF